MIDNKKVMGIIPTCQRGSKVVPRKKNIKLLAGRPNDLFCPLCLSHQINNFKFIPKIKICSDCTLAFNQINEIVNYTKVTDFEIDLHKINKWKKFAIRDFKLIDLYLQSLNNKKQKLNILEVGSGYGLMGDCIQENISIGSYYHYELNESLKKELIQRGQNCIDSFDELVEVDIVIISHVLEHIKDASIFLEDLMRRFNKAEIILYQTNWKGVIPKYFPWIWYGWSLDQHYYHFTPKSLENYFERHDYKSNFKQYYKLDQFFTLSLKGIIKGFLNVINLFVHGEKSDAFVIVFKKR